MDARKRFAEVKAARGYYPVVALGPGSDFSSSSAQLPITAQAPKGSKAKGKGSPNKGSKGHKHKGSGKSPSQGKALARAKATTCLKCGQPGHWAAQCPLSSPSPPTSPAKRARDAAMMAMDSSPSLPSDPVFTVLNDSRLVAQQDGGASAFLGGHRPVMAAISHLIDLGVPADRFRFSRCNRRFMFGGDASLNANWSVHLPVFIRGLPGRLQTFVVEGDTPLLVGGQSSRPCRLRLTSRRISAASLADYSASLIGANGEFLLQLDEGLDEDSLLQPYAFDLMTEDVIAEVPMQEYLDDTGREGPSISHREEAQLVSETAVFPPELDLTSPHLVTVTPGLFKSMDTSIRQAANASSHRGSSLDFSFLIPGFLESLCWQCGSFKRNGEARIFSSNIRFARMGLHPSLGSSPLSSALGV